MIWGAYDSYDPGVWGPWQDLPRREARAAFNRLMAARTERIEALKSLLALNGIDLRGTDAGLQDLNDWFRQEVRPDPDLPGRMALDWYPVVNDVGLFLGDVMVERCPPVSWQFWTRGKTHVSYQRAVVAGFPTAWYSIDPLHLVATYGHRIVGGQQVEDDAFRQWTRAAESRT